MQVKAMIFVLLLTTVLALPAQAQRGGSRNMDGSGFVERLDHAITTSGLTVSFPTGFNCEQISSSFASPHRHDGSLRRSDRNNGLHGGMDLSLHEGTPLLAVAAGEVIAKGEGGQLEGFYIWLRHAPEDTGLSYWVFTKYQHLSELPVMKTGQRVQAGQVIALSGNTGTVSKHYGPAGYPHLHLNMLFGRNGTFSMKGMYQSRVDSEDAVLDDPLILYLAPFKKLSDVRRLSAEQRKVIAPVVDESGRVHPPGSKTVWPVSCKK